MPQRPDCGPTGLGATLGEQVNLFVCPSRDGFGELLVSWWQGLSRDWTDQTCRARRFGLAIVIDWHTLVILRGIYLLEHSCKIPNDS
jgi:hypothetical protein